MKIDINFDKAYAKLSNSSQLRARRILANQVLSDMNQFVPAREFILRMTATIHIDGSAVNYNTPYAAAQFYGFVGRNRSPVHNYTTPGTSRRWDLRAKARYIKDWQKVYLEGLGI